MVLIPIRIDDSDMRLANSEFINDIRDLLVAACQKLYQARPAGNQVDPGVVDVGYLDGANQADTPLRISLDRFSPSNPGAYFAFIKANL